MKNSAKDEYLGFLDSEDGFLEYNKFKKYFYGEDDSLIKELLSSYFSKMNFPEEITICEIGGGDGRRTHKILDFISKKCKKISVDWVEPSNYGAEYFLKSLNLLKNNVSVNIHNKTISDFDTEKKYDLVILIHSIYTASKNDIEKILRLKKDGGRIILVTNPNSGFLYELKEKVDSLYAEKRSEVNLLDKVMNNEKVNYKKTEFTTKFCIENKNYSDFLDNLIFWFSMTKIKKIREAPQNIKDLIGTNSIKRGDKICFSDNEQVTEVYR